MRRCSEVWIGSADAFLESYHDFSLQQPAEMTGEPGVGHQDGLGISDIRVRGLFLGRVSLSMQLSLLCPSLTRRFEPSSANSINSPVTDPHTSVSAE